MDDPAEFELHKRLDEDTLYLGDFPLCRLLMMNDQRFPWFILVPRKAQLTELYHLTEQDRLKYIEETSFLSQKIMDAYAGHKLNVATLGNIVPQLHVHHVVRYREDAAWPAPVWGHGESKPYDKALLRQRLDHLTILSGDLFKPSAFYYEMTV